MDAKRFIMLLNQFKQSFFLELSKLFPKTEVQSFFNILCEFRLNLTRVNIALNPNLTLLEEDLIYFQKALASLKRKVPIQYIIGETTFCGLQFNVDSSVLIPRPETEELVNWIVKDSKSTPHLKILDIGTGSGCIAISLAKKLPNAKISAMDISKKALETAQLNAKKNKVSVCFIEEDILTHTKLPDTFDIIVSNPPYVREMEKKQMQGNVLDNEPHIALFVENKNPLLFYEKITEFAKEHLNSQGNLYFEINQYLGNETTDLIKSKGFNTVQLKKDLFEANRMIKASF